MAVWSVNIDCLIKGEGKVDPEELLDQLAEFHPVTSYGDGMLSTAATVEAPDPVAALDHLIKALTAAVPAHFVVDRAEIMTEARQQRELDIPTFPDMVGIVEIADMAGRSRQRAYQMANENKGFPKPIIETRSGRLWLKAAVERYFEQHRARPLSRTS